MKILIDNSSNEHHIKMNKFWDGVTKFLSQLPPIPVNMDEVKERFFEQINYLEQAKSEGFASHIESNDQVIVEGISKESLPTIFSTTESIISRDQEMIENICRSFSYSVKHFFATYVKNVSESIIIEESKKIQRILYDIYSDNMGLYKLDCWEFEGIIAELLSKQGYKVELSQKTRDDGYDIIALMNIRMQNPLKFLVECKRYTNRKVGVEVIRSFKEVIETEKANRGIIVTTSYFTKGALKKQQETPYLLDYRDKDKVIEWVKDYFDSNKK